MRLAVASGASLIAIARMGRIEVLPRFFETVAATPAGYADAVVDSPALRDAPWLVVRAPEVSIPIDDPALATDDADTIALAGVLRPEWVLADERPLRHALLDRGYRVIGTLGLIEAARAARLIYDPKRELDLLAARGLEVHPRAYASLLR